MLTNDGLVWAYTDSTVASRSATELVARVCGEIPVRTGVCVSFGGVAVGATVGVDVGGGVVSAGAPPCPVHPVNATARMTNAVIIQTFFFIYIAPYALRHSLVWKRMTMARSAKHAGTLFTLSLLQTLNLDESGRSEYHGSADILLYLGLDDKEHLLQLGRSRRLRAQVKESHFSSFCVTSHY